VFRMNLVLEESLKILIRGDRDPLSQTGVRLNGPADLLHLTVRVGDPDGATNHVLERRSARPLTSGVPRGPSPSRTEAVCRPLGLRTEKPSG
jgi:hypothetical protein